jgi:hypothetical protein
MEWKFPSSSGEQSKEVLSGPLGHGIEHQQTGEPVRMLGEEISWLFLDRGR